MSNNELKPCPFCGGSVSITYNSFENAYAVWHKVSDCALIEPLWIEGAETLEDATKIWNTRK